MNEKSAFSKIYDDKQHFILIRGGGAVAALLSYLSSHESDIAYGINDFDELAPLFKAVFDREAEKE